MGAANGKYSSSTKAEQVGTDVDVKGKFVVITGGNTGIGFETARVFASRGANIVIGCRSKERGEAAVAKIRESVGECTVETVPLDLASFASIRGFAQTINDRNTPISLLINNAGIMALPKYQLTKDGFEMQWGVNHLGHFLLTKLLLDRLREGAPSRVVNVSSTAHTMARSKIVFPPTEKGYSATTNYGDSKLSNILFARELNKRESANGVTAYSLHPGVIPTELGRNNGLAAFGYSVGKIFMKSIPQGAATTMFCALDETAIPGGYHSDSAPKEPNAMGTNDELAAQLWATSEKLVTGDANEESPAEVDEEEPKPSTESPAEQDEEESKPNEESPAA